MNGAFHAPPLTAPPVFAKGNQGGKATKWLPAHFNFARENAPKLKKVRPSTLRDWPPCLPVQRDGGRRSRPGIKPFISALTVARCPATFPGVWPQLRDILGLLTKCLFIYFERKNGSKKDAHRRHPIHLIILFKFKAVAERRQWPSAASKPRRKTRVKLCPHFWAAKVPSHQICRLRSASR